MPVTVIEGEQRGDEGKGRFVDALMPEFDIGARFNGGGNAGHTVVAPDGTVHKLHGLPTSIVHEDKKSVIGNGVALNPVTLVKELDNLEARGIQVDPCRLLISSAAHLTLPHHIFDDTVTELGAGRQGSTKSGISPTYGEKARRVGLQAHIIKNNPQALFEIVERELLNRRHIQMDHFLPFQDEEAVAFEYVEAAQRLGKFITDTTRFLNLELAQGTNILAEGAQAFLLDLDHGMYPFVTSSTTIAAGACTGLGIPPGSISEVIGVSKAFQSHVGGGPFVTEIHDPELKEAIHGDMDTVDAERGTTTGRTRRIGYLDLAQTRRSQMVNGNETINLTKLDWIPRFGDKLKICVAYLRKGKMLTDSVDNADKLMQCEPVYRDMENWTEDISEVREFGDLPKAAQEYINTIEEVTEKKVTRIGVGFKRDQVIDRTKD